MKSVFPVLLILYILTAGCIQIKTPELPQFTPDVPMDIHFSNVEAYTNGEVSVTITKGSTTAQVGSISWSVIYNITSANKSFTFTYLLTKDSIFFVNNNLSTLDAPITGGDTLVIKTGNKWDDGQIVRLKVVEKRTGRIFDDIKIKVKAR